MKKLVLLLALSSFALVAAADDKVVIKDTRTYLTQDGQKMLFGGEPVAIGGELLTRTADSCDRTIYKGSNVLPPPPPKGAMSIVMPQIQMTRDHYQCDSAGNRV